MKKKLAFIILFTGLLTGCSDSPGSSSSEDKSPTQPVTAEISEPVTDATEAEHIEVNGLTIISNGNYIDIMDGSTHVQSIENEVMYPPEYKDVNGDGYDDIFIRNPISSHLNYGTYYIYDSVEKYYVPCDMMSNMSLLFPDDDPENAEKFGVKENELFDCGDSFAEIYGWKGSSLILTGHYICDVETGEMTQLYRQGTYKAEGEIVPASGLNETDGLSYVLTPEAVYIKDAIGEKNFVTISGDFSAGKCILLKDYNFDQHEDFAVYMKTDKWAEEYIYFLYDPEKHTFVENDELNNIQGRLLTDPVNRILTVAVASNSYNRERLMGFVQTFVWDDDTIVTKESGSIMEAQGGGYDIEYHGPVAGEISRTEHISEIPAEWWVADEADE
ncbi:MAG: hypothetical protein GXY08_06610 [Ruminococcus sp.]|nr:hypothetical protein [Ruminococcus sp.]